MTTTILINVIFIILTVKLLKKRLSFNFVKTNVDIYLINVNYLSHFFIFF